MKALMSVFAALVPWPTPDQLLNPPGLFKGYTDAIDVIEAGAATSDDPALLDLSFKLFDNDANQRLSIDSRAGAMMSAITLAAALVTGVGFTAFNDTSKLPNGALWVMFGSFLLALLYLTATTILFFQIQGRISRATLDPTDLVPPPHANPSRYPRWIAIKVLRYTVFNYSANNSVINKLWVAQKCFRNALLTLVGGGILTSVILLYPGSVTTSGLRLAQALARRAGCVDLPPLAMDRKGRWRGTCATQGRSMSVFVDVDGTTSLKP